MSHYDAFLNQYPYNTKQLASRCRLDPSRIRQMVSFLAQRGCAIQTDGGWRFTKQAVTLVKNRRSEILPYL